jgi:hypothetical protein
MDDHALSDEIRGKLLDKLISITKEKVGRLWWQPANLFGHYGYIAYYDKYTFYLEHHYNCIDYYDLFVIEGKPFQAEAMSRISHSKNKDLWRCIKALPPINEENLMFIMGLEEDLLDQSLSEGEKKFLAEQYSPGTFAYYDSSNPLHINLFKKRYLEVSTAGIPRLIGLTNSGRITAKKCWEELNVDPSIGS